MQYRLTYNGTFQLAYQNQFDLDSNDITCERGTSYRHQTNYGFYIASQPSLFFMRTTTGSVSLERVGQLTGMNERVSLSPTFMCLIPPLL
jgi:hypothetical protein